MHLMATHFIKALDITPIFHAKQQLHRKSFIGKKTWEKDDDNAEGDDKDEEEDSNEELNIDVDMEVEASADHVDALHEASLTNFNAGDIVSKLMALIAQLRACGEDTQDYLKELGKMQGCPEWEIKLWIQTHWGSLVVIF